MKLTRNDIMRVIVGVPRNMDTEDGYEEVAEDFEIVGSSGEDRTNHMERYVEDITGQWDRSEAWLKLTHKKDVS